MIKIPKKTSALKKKRGKLKKFDWVKIKQEFFESDEIEVKSFVNMIGVEYNAHIGRMTKGWTKEKEEEKLRVFIESRKKAESILIENGAGSYINVMSSIFRRVVTKDRADSLSVSDIKNIWEMISVFNNKPTKVSENRNANVNVDVEISDQDNENVRKALKENGLI